MFSQLGPLFKSQFRKTESNDTRQNIPHKEQDIVHNNRDNKEQKSTSDEAWTDDTSVSVNALRAFLIDFLKTLPGGNDNQFLNQIEPAENPNSRPKEKARPTNTRNAKAVRAYQTMAAHAAQLEPPINHHENSSNEPTADKLQSKEIRDIYSLIQDLDILAARGITNLNFLLADSFVESLKQAVELEKSKF